MHYYIKTRKKLNFKKLVTFNEKIQGLKIKKYMFDYHIYVDKLLVRDFVEDVIGKEYLIGLIDSNIKEINFDNLPQKFVAKCNHDSGGIAIYSNDKNAFLKNVSDLKKRLKYNFYDFGREPTYKKIKPLLFIEEYIQDKNGDLPDYKFFCFDGKVEMIQYDWGRFTNHYRNVYNGNWELIDLEMTYPSNKEVDIPKPINFDLMKEIACKLSSNFQFVRVDLYNVDGKIYFGELTFTPENGEAIFSNANIEKKLGELIKL